MRSSPARLLLLAAALFAPGAQAQTPSTLQLDFARKLGPLEIDRISLGQGGLSEDPMFDGRIAEIRALHPRLIRLFVQEYFDLLPAPGRHHFDSLDRSVEAILRTGAKPLMALAFKPAALFPAVDQDRVEPADYAAWEDLVFRLVRHYKDRGAGIHYWEVANEPDIGEDGGSPYRFKPESYARYYQHTAAAIRRADPDARVGGPALAYWRSPLLPALLAACAAGKAPLDFVSWHIYSSDPLAVRKTIEGVKALLAKYPGLKPETILDEWNMALTTPPKDPRVQPCYVAEVAWQMKDAGLDYSCYYHIRDYHVDRDRFARFFSAKGASFMANWWNRMPQYDGLFDYQNTVRPAYFVFKLLSRLTGERLAAESNSAAVHAFLTHDESYGVHSLLVWNFSAAPVEVAVEVRGLARNLVAKRRMLDAAAPGADENVRLRPLDDLRVTPAAKLKVPLEPYGVEFWSLEPAR
jgi:xylan 1,4-beta-xylosidase